MADSEDDFDSSDIEVPPLPENPFALHGEKGVRYVLEHKSGGRIASKIAFKSLTSCHGAPGTRARKQKWKKIWMVFYQESLRHEYITPAIASSEVFSPTLTFEQFS